MGFVDPGSPAAKAGLQAGDEVVEVNGHNVQEESHTGVVQRFKENPGSVRLLVADENASQFFLNNNMRVSEAHAHGTDTGNKGLLSWMVLVVVDGQ